MNNLPLFTTSFHFNLSSTTVNFYELDYSLILLLGILPTPPPAPVVQQVAPLYPLDVPENTHYVLQVRVINIDGTKSGLTQDRGFRRFVQRHCSNFGLSGLVWRIPRVHGKILARGIPSQLDQLLAFVKDLVVYGFIESWVVENKQDFRALSNVFAVMPSNRPRVITGDFSDPDLDDVVSTGSADISVVGSPVPQHV